LNAQHLLNQHIQTPIHSHHNKYSLPSLFNDVWLFIKGAKKDKNKQKIIDWKKNQKNVKWGEKKKKDKKRTKKMGQPHFQKTF
jgi:hypothetical protein